MPVALLALALGGFGIGLTEFGVMGLLPEVSSDLGVSETTAGWLISGYALSVAVGGVVLTLGMARLPRKPALMGLMVLFIVGNLLSALGDGYDMVMLGRIVAALCHGAFFGIGAVVAAQLVAPDRKGQAIAFMFGGLTLANVLGVPLGTLLGQQVGWRATFVAITVIGVIALAGIALWVPAHLEKPAAGGVRIELAVFARPQVWGSIALTVLGFGGMFGGFSYMAFTLTEVTGFSSGAVPWLLVLFGVGLFVGNLWGGKAADRNLPRALMVILVALASVLVLFATTAASKPAAVVFLLLMGGFGFATVPGLQMRIMNHAADAPTLASGANIAAFNLGNALGAWLAGLAIAAGWGYASPLWVAAGVTLGAVVVLLVVVNAPGGERHPGTSAASREPEGAAAC